MGTRTTDLRGFLKQRRSQKTSEAAADERSSSYLLNSAAPGSRSRKECDDDEELVKYMSKLPAYLQEDESNVLNVGVLDWSRLEKWKQQHGRARAADRSAKTETKVSSTTLGTLPNASHHSLGCTLEPELASSSSRDSSSLNKQEMPTCSYKSSSARDQERVKSSRRPPSSSSGSLLSTMGNSDRGLLAAKGRSFVSRDKETEKRAAGEVEARERGKQKCVDKLDGKQKVSNIVLLRSRKQSPSTLLSSEPPHLPSDDNNAKVARREVNRSFDLLERDSEDDMMLPLLLAVGVDLSPKKEPSGGTKTASRRIFDQEKKKRDPSSPTKQRFSFSFGRLSTSFTFKEEDSSVKAGQPWSFSDSMRFDGSACPSQSSNPEEKHITLRRLLDPLLKSKDPDNVLLPSSGSSNQDEKETKKQDTRALFQLTIRNGIPLFQFVVDDEKSRSILGATMKTSSTSSFKDDDSVQYCTFYSVNEVKKKKSRSWLTHGHKEKQQHRFVYNVIGEMRLCNSSTEQKSGGNISSVMRESVLVDETEQVKGRKEVAAVVIKKKKKHADGETTVIIPGGVHSIPEKGAPTPPLIRRWRSGGCCDCGGWDVGCKLHVLLSNKTFLHDLDQPFKLFDQEGSDGNCRPVLAMRELKKGIYRVEFGSFLSPLQAFFVCVTVITCASEEKTVVSKTTGKSSSPFAPPLSPVGRA
ncbi:hypothetical protein N665_0163s0072 [Sinapis alba]|nr:hypothetical protein N665_0163s0072 [Sinapis alba]